MPDTASHRFAVLDAWRGICACFVAVVHIPVAHGWKGWQPFVNMQLFVDFFFVLSGFVICHAYGDRLGDRRRVASFMLRRLGRVWPLHMAVLACFVVLELAKLGAGFVVRLPLDGVPFTAEHSVPALISNVFLTQAFGLHGMTSWNGPAWSIGTEFYTYAVFAAVVTIAGGARALVLAVVAAAGLAGVVAFSPTWMFTTHDFGFARCLYGFFTGCVVYRAMSGGLLPMPRGTASEVAAIGILACFLLATGPDATSLLAPMVFALILGVFASESGAVSRSLLCGPAQALGLWSYSIYMVHMLVFALLKIVLTILAKVPGAGLSAPVTEPVKMWSFGDPTLDAVLVALHLVLVVVLARVTYARVEAPARAWFATLAEAYEARTREAETGGQGSAAIAPAARSDESSRRPVDAAHATTSPGA